MLYWLRYVKGRDMKLICAYLFLLLTPCVNADEMFAVQLPECTARLERRIVESDVVLVRSECLLSLPSLVQLLDAGLLGLFPDHNLPIHGIYLGRLMNYPDWSKDLARVAAKSVSWNSKRGRPKSARESENQRVRLLLNGSAYPQILKPLFEKYELTACIADVEKVLVFKAKEVFPDKEDRPVGISAEARLPVDAQIWLTLRPMPNDCGK